MRERLETNADNNDSSLKEYTLVLSHPIKGNAFWNLENCIDCEKSQSHDQLILGRINASTHD